jgi:hypothetical protein
MAHVAIRHSSLLVPPQNPVSQAKITPLQLPRSNQLAVFPTSLSQVANQLIGVVYLSDHLHLAVPKSLFLRSLIPGACIVKTHECETSAIVHTTSTDRIRAHPDPSQSSWEYVVEGHLE